MSADTLRRDGGWRVELVKPLEVGGKTVDAIDIDPPSLDHVIRWGQREIASSLGLLAELSGVPEAALRTIGYPDVDRVLRAFVEVLPPSIRKDFEDGNRPLATPKEAKAAQTAAEAAVRPNDQQDPRFPSVPGVVRMPPEIVKKAEIGGLDMAVPGEVRKVG